MSDGGKLTQEEIDALLGNSINHTEESSNTAEIGLKTFSHNLRDFLSEMEEDVLGEIGNISFGSAATALSTLLNQKVDITTPTVSLIERDELESKFPVPYVSILVNYTEGFTGSNLLIIKMHDASIIANLMMGGDGQNVSGEINEMELSAVQEAMNQMMGSSATSMSTVFDRKVDISPPITKIMNLKENEGIENLPEDDMMLQISFDLKVGSLIDSNIMQIIPLDFAKTLVEKLLNQSEQTSAAIPVPTMDNQIAVDDEEEVNHYSSFEDEESSLNINEERKEHHWSEPYQQPKKKPAYQDVQTAEFSTFEEESNPTHPQNIDMLMDIPLNISVELGSTKKTIKEVLELGPGSIIELEKLAGEPIDILVNQKYIAKGEVVVVDENFGVRITEILNQKDRLNKI
ncbi:flagellar motor switch phosphatase FliY [Terrilactibacillus sp. BCM23-1]|uniref:Flagellar motor switch phosphatase FliY n=1 Tax=Terrilactibacillus tamarindi TaxID=2599694 RepID=A0A6N8CPZ7_9BACI|nr:flagellar motor switch phosphatase FliY [Terrilactibacillus tamarindi]MTT32269.1 flagellar motor switch phosphatase FliY [Terrilactibacillus tamarindi]